MYKADLYNKLSLLTGKTFAELERDLGAGNGTINKSIQRKSTIKALTIDKIVKLYPKHVKALGIDMFESGNFIKGGFAEKPTEQASQPDIAISPQQHIAALNEALVAWKQTSSAEREAKEAYKKIADLTTDLATTFATKDAVQAVSQGLGELSELVRDQLLKTRTVPAPTGSGKKKQPHQKVGAERILPFEGI